MSYGQSTLAWLVVVMWYTGSAALALRKHPSHRTVHPSSHPARTASTAPTPPHTPRTASSTSPPHLARLRPLQAARKEDGKLSYAHTRSTSARCPSFKHRRTLPPSCIRLRAALLTPRPSSLPQVTPSHEINLIKPGKIVVTNYCCWRRARWYCLTHVRLTGSHMHSIFIRQVQVLLYLLLALY